MKDKKKKHEEEIQAEGKKKLSQNLKSLLLFITALVLALHGMNMKHTKKNMKKKKEDTQRECLICKIIECIKYMRRLSENRKSILVLCSAAAGSGSSRRMR